MWFFDLLPWWGWLVSSIGIVGVIALALFLPEAFALLVKGAGALLRQLLATRIGCAVLAAIAAGVLAGMYQRATDAEACRIEIQELKDQAAAAATARDAEITAAIEKKYAPLLEQIESRAGELQEKVTAYERNTKPDARCLLGAEPLQLRPRSR